MFKSLYKTHEHSDRRLGEAVLNGKGAIISVVMLLLYQVILANLLSIGMQWCNDNMGTNFSTVELNTVLQIITIALMLLFFGRFYWDNLKTFFKEFKAVYLWAPVACYALSIAGNMAVQMLLMMIRGSVETTTNNNVVNEMLLSNPIQMILVTVIFAPFVEETIFRAGMCRPLTVSKNYFIKSLGFIISVFVFALLHVYQYAFFGVDANGAVYLTFNANEFLSILSYIPMAVGFAVCSYLCKNFWGSVICHMMTNAISVALMLLLSLLGSM